MDKQGILLLRDYLRAAAVLYGCIPLRSLYRFFCQHNGNGLTAGEFCRLAREAQGPREPFRIVGDDDIYRSDLSVSDLDRRVIHRRFCYASWDALFALEYAQEGKSPRAFSKEEMLLYADPDYLPDTPQIRDLWQCLFQCSAWEEPLSRVMVQAVALGTDDADARTFLKEMQHLGCRFGSLEDRWAAIQCYRRVWETVPKPIHCGHSEEELGARKPLPPQDLWFCPPSSRDPFSLTEQEVAKTYPCKGNTDYQGFLDRCMAETALPPRMLEPCPCGSGLNYEDCCGKR